MKVLLDMNLPPKLAELLSRREIDSVHWCRIGAPNARDSELMDYALKNGHILVSCDMDFNAILSVTHGCKPSIVQVRVTNFCLEQMADLLSNALHQYEEELNAGAIMSIDLKKARVRLLPL